MYEFIGIVIALIMKWFKSSGFRHHRKLGFLGAVVVAVYWFVFWCYSSYWWLALYNVMNMCIAIRGMYNNRVLGDSDG